MHSAQNQASAWSLSATEEAFIHIIFLSIKIERDVLDGCRFSQKCLEDCNKQLFFQQIRYRLKSLKRFRVVFNPNGGKYSIYELNC